MRIIGGEFGGIRIRPPVKMPHTRPTTDVAKEGLFNILHHTIVIHGIKTLDLFGGTGSISYELASRGAGELTLVEKDPHMVEFIKKTAQQLAFPGFKVVKSDVFRFISSCNEKYDFIFAGPPYQLAGINELPHIIFKKELLTRGGRFVLEHTVDLQFRDYPWFESEKKYGTTVFSIFINP